MLICIPDILDRPEIEAIRVAIASVVFLDGRKTAGTRAKRVKNNQQMDQGSDAAKEIKARVLAAVTWVRSQVRDPARREILYDICRMREQLAKLHPDGEEADLAFKTHANLLRMWSE